MKKHIVSTALASVLTALVSCSTNYSASSESNTDEAVRFAAYGSSLVTKGVTEVVSDIIGPSGKGIGVFAFMQPAKNGNKQNFNSNSFLTPNFMYNQQVNENDGVWSYDPVKFWPNGASDQVSFFAYAPYKAGTVWEDLGISTDITGSELYASVTISRLKTGMKDILWAIPQINQTNKTDDGMNALEKRVDFQFSHILSKVNLSLGIDNSKTSATVAEPWNDANTVITIISVEMTGLASRFDFVMDTASANWSISGNQDIILEGSDIRNNIISAALWDTTSWGAATVFYKDLLSQEGGADASLFLAPQVFTAGKEKIIVKYRVETSDPLHPLNNATKTNTITADLSTVFVQGLESGKSYSLKLLIGLNQVNFDSSAGAWTGGDTSDITI